MLVLFLLIGETSLLLVGAHGRLLDDVVRLVDVLEYLFLVCHQVRDAGCSEELLVESVGGVLVAVSYALVPIICHTWLLQLLLQHGLESVFVL